MGQVREVYQLIMTLHSSIEYLILIGQMKRSAVKYLTANVADFLTTDFMSCISLHTFFSHRPIIQYNTLLF